MKPRDSFRKQERAALYYKLHNLPFPTHQKNAPSTVKTVDDVVMK